MSGTIPVTAKISYRRFQVPNFATQDMPARPKQDGLHALPSTPIAELDPAVLDALAAAWIWDLYDKAGRERPVIGPALSAAKPIAKAQP